MVQVDAAAIVPRRVLGCSTCGEAAGFGFMVFEEGAGPAVYKCPAHGFTWEQVCDDCDGPCELVAAESCPEEDFDDELHDWVWQTVCQCPFCTAAGEEIQYFDPKDIAGHLRDHDQPLEAAAPEASL